MNKNYFQGNADHPWHISVGAILLNTKNEVCCHYFKEIQLRKDEAVFKDMYILMRETIEPNESLEITLRRGLMEEFGAEGVLRTYVGSIKSQFPYKGIIVEKTNLYFLVDLIKFEPEKKTGTDRESESQIQWQSIDFLIEKMKRQSIRMNRDDVDESSILGVARELLLKTAA